MKNTILIVPYIGSFPSYFNIFLKSCGFNPEFDWLFVTNDRSEYNYPPNTKVIYLTFDELRKLFKNKLGDEIILARPHKLCDYKVTYGYVFSEWINGYDYWGHCDIDVLYGRLKEFVKPLYDQEFDKIFSLGHLSLYRNTPLVNSMFMSSVNGERVYKKVFSSDFGYAFDEWHCKLGSINHIFKNSEFKFFEKNLCANLDSSTSGFRLSDYNISSGHYETEDYNRQIFSWVRGILTKYQLIDGKIETQTYPYIHFHKRKMDIRFDAREESFLIVPNKFVPFPEHGIGSDLIKHYTKKAILNKQFLKVKYINLLYLFRVLISRIRLS